MREDTESMNQKVRSGLLKGDGMIILVLLLFIAGVYSLGFIFGRHAGRKSMQRTAVSKAAAHYSPSTGGFKWGGLEPQK